MKIEKLNEKVDWKVAMEGNNSNIDRLRNVATQVNIDPVMGEVVRENEESDKQVGDTFKKLSKELDGVTPKNPDTGKKVTIKPYTERLALDESLFDTPDEILEGKKSSKKKHLCEDVDEPIAVLSLTNFGGIEIYDINDEEVTYAINDGENVSEKETVELKWDCEDENGDCSPYFNIGDNKYFIRDFIRTKIFESKKLHESDSGIEYRDMMYEMVENGDVDAEEILRDLIYWVTEDDMEEFMRIRDLIPKKKVEDESVEIDESMSLKEYVDEDDVEEDEYTVIDLLNDRLFGYGINKSNFRLKWKFAEIGPFIKNSKGTVKRGYFYPTSNLDNLVTNREDDRRAFVDNGIGVFVRDEDEAALAKKCAEELKLDFNMKKLVRPINGFNYIASIKVPDEIQEMPIKDYVESIGKSMKDFLRGSGETLRTDFTDSANYSSRKEKE